MRYELSETLAALVESLEPPPGSGIVLTDARLRVPLEVQTAQREGALVFYGRVAHTRWRWGVLPPLQSSDLHVVLVEEDGRAA